MQKRNFSVIFTLFWMFCFTLYSFGQNSTDDTTYAPDSDETSQVVGGGQLFTQGDNDSYKAMLKDLSGNNKVEKIYKDFYENKCALSYDEMGEIIKIGSENKAGKELIKNIFIKAKVYDPLMEQIVYNFESVEKDAQKRKVIYQSIFDNKINSFQMRLQAIKALAKDKEFNNPEVFKNYLESNTLSKEDKEIVCGAWHSYIGREEASITTRNANIGWLKKYIDENYNKTDFPESIFELFVSCEKEEAINYLSQYLDMEMQNDASQAWIIMSLLNLADGYKLLVERNKLGKQLIKKVYNTSQEGIFVSNLAVDKSIGNKAVLNFIAEEFENLKSNLGDVDYLKFLIMLIDNQDTKLCNKIATYIGDVLKKADKETRLLAYKCSVKYSSNPSEAYNLLQKFAEKETDGACKYYLSSVFSDRIFTGEKLPFTK